MRRAGILIGFIALVFVLGALIGPAIYRLMQLSGVASDVSFTRVVSRVLLMVALIGLWPLARLLRATPANLGWRRLDTRDVIAGSVIGLISLGAFLVIATACDARDVRATLNGTKIVKCVLLAAGAALVVAPLEETLFRGVCFGLLRGKRWVPAMFFSSLLFAMVHLLQTPRSAVSSPVHWLDGFKVLAEMFSQQPNALLAAATVANLTLCGMILCLAFQRTGSLWFSISVHAAWIFWLKLANTITTVPLDASRLWGTRKLIDAWAVFPLLLLTFLAVELLARRNRAQISSEHTDLGLS